MSKIMFNRLRVLLIIILFTFMLLGARLAYLQVYQHEYYTFRAEENRFTKLPISAARGKVFCRDGDELITNRPGFSIFLVDLDEDYDSYTIDFLSEVLEIDEEEIIEKIYDNRYTRYLPIHLADVDYETMSRIAEHRWKLQGVNIEVQPLRDYPYKELGAHIVGFISQAPASESMIEKWEKEGYTYKEGDVVGQQGLEKAWEAHLRGVDGEQLIETNSIGQPIDYLEREDPVPGHNLHLTFDVDLQRAAMESLEKRINQLRSEGNRYAQRGSAVAMDPNTGAILALASYPSYDPNKIREDYQELSEDTRRPLVNYTINGAYPIGSAYKMVTGAAALETGKISGHSVLHCGGSYTAVGDTKDCHSYHGNLNLYRALAVSCNIYFYRAGLAAGIDKLAYYTEEMGLGKRTGLRDIPGESEGVVASREYKEERFGERWYPAETMSAAIGQTFHQFTPLQLAVYSSILANGGQHYRPYLVDRVEDINGETVMKTEPEVFHQADLSPGAISSLQEGMRQVCRSGGTAGGHFHDFPVEVAGKTGSAQVAVGRSNIPAHSIFVSFAPYENPEIALAVVIEYGEYGALSSTPVAKDILEHYFDNN